MKTKLAGLAAVLFAAVLWWVARPDSTPPPVDATPMARAEPAVAALADAPATSAPLPTLQREPVTAAAGTTTGELVVTVRYADEPTIAAGRTVLVRRRGGDLRVGVLRAITDDQGVARFAGLAPGELRVRVGGSSRVVAATVTAGRSSPCELALRKLNDGFQSRLCQPGIISRPRLNWSWAAGSDIDAPAQRVGGLRPDRRRISQRPC